ncbi:hypothetical protein EYF80_031548 [Liparis tanakae]|uniref:Uncharacterized protein n=1 Tax=Liparis tanakae TaxID=230148 RepID=A0A4Z2GXJ2_9TELE|nr:hypothetical protein EYF80_031548 [Liparis tanakae]
MHSTTRLLCLAKFALAEVLGGSDVKTLTERKVFTDSLRPGATTSEKNVLASGQEQPAVGSATESTQDGANPASVLDIT